MPLTVASAQVNCQGLSVTTCQIQQQHQLLQPFASLPFSAAGLAVLQADMAAVENIYFSASPDQRNQAAINANLGQAATQNTPSTQYLPQLNLWSQIDPSSPLLPTLQAFPQLQNSAALAPILAGRIAGQAGVFGDITQLLHGTSENNPGILDADQVHNLKLGFFSYAQAFPGQLTRYSLPTSEQSDPRPYQISPAIANAPWTGTQANAYAQSVQTNPNNPNVQWGTPGTGGGNNTDAAFPSGHSTEGFLTSLLYAIMLPQAYQSMMVSGQQFGLSRNILGVHHVLDVMGARINSYYVMAQLLAGNPNYPGYPAFGGSVRTYADNLTATLNQINPALTAVPYAACATNVAACIANGAFPTAAQLTEANQAYVVLSTWGLPSTGPTNLAPVVPGEAELLIASRFPYLSSRQRLDVLASTELPSGGPLDNGTGWARLNLFAAAGGYGAFLGNVTVTMDASLGGFSAIDMWSNNISGPGGLTKLGTGTLVLGGDNTYTGGTTVGGGTLALSGSMIGNLTILPGATFVTGGGYAVSPISTLSNAGTFQSVNVPLVNQGTLNNSGTMVSSLVNSGAVSNTGTIVGNVLNGGTFANNGVVNGTFSNLGLLSGNGTLIGNLTNANAVAPGNSIGTLNVTGNFTQLPSASYQLEVNSAGQSDLVNVTGTASLQGGTVSLTALPGGTYSPRTTYRILSATGGVAGTFGAVTDPYIFLFPSLSYDPNNVYLTLQIGGFAAAAQTPVQAAVGRVLDANVATASGDFLQVLSSMAVNTLSPSQAQATLTSLSGQNYSTFSSTMVQGAQLFMNNFASQTGGGAPAGNRVALAEACDVACDTTQPATWGAWGGGLGGLGTIGASSATGAVTYNVGGFAAGLDRLVAPGLRVGVTAGYTSGTQWTSGFSGKGATDTVLAGLYGNFVHDKVYADAMVGYGYSYNQMWRQISIPGLQPRTAQGQAGANQFYGQLETGYRFDIGTAAQAYVTPFARLQGYTGAQNGFTENGAQSLNLTVAQQNTSSLRTVLGAQLGGAVDLGWREKLALQLRLGWSHEYANTARPVTATLAGAPLMPFTTYGVAPTRDGALLGFSANTAIADATSVYLRYEGNISGQDSAHALTAGVRMTW